LVKTGADDEKAFASAESFEEYRKKKETEEVTIDIMPWLSRLTLDIIGVGEWFFSGPSSSRLELIRP